MTDRPRTATDAPAPRTVPQAAREVVVATDQAAIPDVQPTLQSRDAPPAPAHMPAPAAHHLDPRPVMQQVASAMVTTRKDVTEIALAPEELGRLRLVISGPDRSHVTIWAERPETLDLVRRNADMLTQHLQEAGIETSDMEFRQDDGGAWQAEDTVPHPADGENAEIPLTTHVRIATTPVSDRRLDIRL